MNRLTTLIASLVLLAPAVVCAGGKIPHLKKIVVISAEQAAGLTNRTERLLHDIRMPEVDFRQAAIADIVTFLNHMIQETATTEEAKRITIVLDPATEKELMTFHRWEGGGGIDGVFTFGGLDMSVLEAICELQKVSQLGRKIDGTTLILIKKQEPEKVQPKPDSDGLKPAP